jgi:hypothetical protein
MIKSTASFKIVQTDFRCALCDGHNVAYKVFLPNVQNLNRHMNKQWEQNNEPVCFKNVIVMKDKGRLRKFPRLKENEARRLQS